MAITQKKQEMKSKKLFDYDLSLKKTIIGTDEAGRGCGAGGVFAAAVCFNNNLTKDLRHELAILNDSKKLSKKHREEIFDIIKNNTINSVICIEVEEIERINILNASLKAMNLACSDVIKQISAKEEELLVLVDGNRLIRQFDYPQLPIIKGDGTSASIAAASILAKVTRDRWMKKLDEMYPQYGLAKHKGYPTKAHIEALNQYGLQDFYRRSYGPVKKLEEIRLLVIRN